MRWTYLIPRLIILGIIWAFMAFGFDPLLRYSVVQTAQSITGAKADVPSLQTGFFPPKMFVNSVALASRTKPGTNLVEFDEMRLQMAGDPLLRKSFVVDEAVVTGVRFGTSRSDNGQLEVEEDAEPAGPIIPPWLSDKMKNIGDEWVENFTQQAKQQLDPNRLESYRVGNELYIKWDGRFKEMNVRLDTSRAQLEALKRQIDEAKKGETIEQVEKYLQIAQQSDLLLRDTRGLLTQFKTNVPRELQQDFARLDQAQKNDRATAAEAIQMLKPDSRQITESLIGEEMYLQLQTLLTWVETLRGYQEDLKAPEAPERSRGRDFEFPLYNPTPGMLCRRMSIDGEFMLSDIPTPFSATLTDVTSDPKMHGRPALLRVTTEGESPVDLVVRHDATGDITKTDLGVNYTDCVPQQLSAGKPDRDHVTASIDNIRWVARLTLVEDGITGRIDVMSDFGQPQVRVQNRYAASLAGMAEQTLAGISTVNATLQINGTIRNPQIDISSNLGEQMAVGFETAFASFVPLMKQQLTAELNTFVDKQRQEFIAKYQGKASELLADYENVISGLNQANELASAFRSGNLQPDAVFKFASDNGMLKEKDQQKVEEYRSKTDDVLNGLRNPQQTLQDKLPGLLKKKLF